MEIKQRRNARTAMAPEVGERVLSSIETRFENQIGLLIEYVINRIGLILFALRDSRDAFVYSVKRLRVCWRVR